MLREYEGRQSATVDDVEVARFAELSAKWWDPKGEFRALHLMGPARLTFIRDCLVSHFGKQVSTSGPLDGLKILDVGCGGGLICEPLRRLGAHVTGIDPAKENVAAAKSHAKAVGLDISYQSITVEELVGTGARFDAVLCLEVIEHVPDVAKFFQHCAALVRPGGLMIVSTLNRTVKSYGLAILAAEYVLGWVPRGTHRWDRFVTPDELNSCFKNIGLTPESTSGIVYDPLRDDWQLSQDCDVNYLMAASKLEQC